MKVIINDIEYMPKPKPVKKWIWGVKRSNGEWYFSPAPLTEEQAVLHSRYSYYTHKLEFTEIEE